MDRFRPRALTREQRSRAQGNRMSRRQLRQMGLLGGKSMEALRREAYELATGPIVSTLKPSSRATSFVTHIGRVADESDEDRFGRFDEPGGEP